MTEPKFIPPTFQAQSNFIASYSYTDIAEGTGVQKFYLAVSEDSSGNDYNLLTQEVYSDEIELIEDGGYTASANFTKMQDIDFDLSAFNKPKTIGGTGYFTFSTGELTSCSAGQEVLYYFIFKVRKYSGTTESEIASAQSKEYGFGYEASPTIRAETAFFPITIPNTHFKRGDILRLTIEIWARGEPNVNGAGTFTIGVDPQNRDGTYINPSTDDPTTTTQCLFYCPFRFEEIGY